MSGSIDAQEPVSSAVPIPDLSAIDKALAAGDESLKAALQGVRPADIGRDLSRRKKEDGRRLLLASDDRSASAMLRSAHPAVSARLVADMDPAHAARLLGFMATDHRVAVLAALSEEQRGRIEQAFEKKEKEAIDRILSYPASAVGRIMTPKIWRTRAGQTAGGAMADLRARSSQIEVAQNCYVTDAEDRLVGVVPLRQVAIAAPETQVEQIMTRNPIAVSEDTGRGDAAEIIKTLDFLSLPVLDKTGKLVGAVRVDDLLDAALDRVGTGILNQGGVVGKIAAQIPYFQTSMTRTVRSRLTWLILLFVAETATGTVLRHFEGELAKVVALSFFVPLLIGTGGNAGSQTVSTIIRALALGEVRFGDIARVILKESATGLLLGLLLGAIAFGRALLWGVSYDLALCVAVTILTVCTWANTVGAAIPLLAQKAHIDPTVVSAPLITTLVDASGLFIYFTVAHLTIASLH